MGLIKAIKEYRRKRAEEKSLYRSFENDIRAGVFNLKGCKTIKDAVLKEYEIYGAIKLANNLDLIDSYDRYVAMQKVAQISKNVQTIIRYEEGKRMNEQNNHEVKS